MVKLIYNNSKRTYVTVLALSLCCLLGHSLPSYAVEALSNPSSYEGTLTLSGLPKYEDYSAVVENITNPQIDLSSHQRAKEYETVLTDSVKGGVNFAGRYTVVMHGCGTNCQVNWIVNLASGKVLGPITSIAGIEFRKDSKLLIVNPPEQGWDDIVSSDYPGYWNVEFYVVEDDKVQKIREFNLSGIVNSERAANHVVSEQ